MSTLTPSRSHVMSAPVHARAAAATPTSQQLCLASAALGDTTTPSVAPDVSVDFGLQTWNAASQDKSFQPSWIAQSGSHLGLVELSGPAPATQQYVDLNAIIPGGMPQFGPQVTIHLWLKWTQQDQESYKRIFDFRTETASSVDAFLLYRDALSDQLNLHAFAEANNYVYHYIPPDVYTMSGNVGNWHSITIVMSGVVHDFYYNGGKTSYHIPNGLALRPANRPIAWLGKSTFGDLGRTYAQFDSFQLWAKNAFTPQAVARLFALQLQLPIITPAAPSSRIQFTIPNATQEPLNIYQQFRLMSTAVPTSQLSAADLAAVTVDLSQQAGKSSFSLTFPDSYRAAGSFLTLVGINTQCAASKASPTTLIIFTSQQVPLLKPVPVSSSSSSSTGGAKTTQQGANVNTLSSSSTASHNVNSGENGDKSGETVGDGKTLNANPVASESRNSNSHLIPIIIGCAVGACALILLIWYLVRRHRRRNNAGGLFSTNKQQSNLMAQYSTTSPGAALGGNLVRSQAQTQVQNSNVQSTHSNAMSPLYTPVDVPSPTATANSSAVSSRSQSPVQSPHAYVRSINATALVSNAKYATAPNTIQTQLQSNRMTQQLQTHARPTSNAIINQAQPRRRPEDDVMSMVSMQSI